MSSEVESRHRKELKALEGEKRAALKKAKGTKGKKAKEALASVEEDYAQKLADLRSKQKEELTASGDGDAGIVDDSEPVTDSLGPDQSADAIKEVPEQEDSTASARERKQAKARRKREKQKQLQLEREAEQERDLNDPNTARRLELEILKTKLDPLQLEIREVASDGHCLYRAVAAQVNEKDFLEIRRLCAQTLEQHESDFSPFCEFGEGVTSYSQYIDRVKNSSDWGGHVELRALSLVLQKKILVYSAQHVEPLVMGEENSEAEPIRLSYHLHYYALGEHYNHVILKKGDDDQS